MKGPFRLLWMNGREFPITGQRGDILLVATEASDRCEFWWPNMRIREVTEAEYAACMAEVQRRRAKLNTIRQESAQPLRCPYCGKRFGTVAGAHAHQCPGKLEALGAARRERRRAERSRAHHV